MLAKSIRGWAGARLLAAAGMLGATLVAGVGCRSWQPATTQEDAPRGSVDATMSSTREPGPKGQMLGLDPRSREIERNLGIR